MNRQNFRNIGNNFVQGGVQQPGAVATIQSPVATRATRANPNIVPVQEEQNIQPQPVAVPPVVAAVPMKTDDDTNMSMSEEDLIKLKKINFKKKISGKEKRLRQNRKLYRMLTPRNAIAALNELHGQSVNESVVLPTQGNKFEAEITINNVRYTGVGNSKMQAKNAASEKALRDLVITKFQQFKSQDIPAIPTPTPSVTDGGEDVAMEEDTKADDIPMLQLASFALHKLFAEWESEGFEIPFPKTNPQQPAVPAQPGAEGVEAPPVEPKVAVPKPPKVRNELPPNNLQMHPVMLLSIMRPCTQYTDLGSQGVTPNIVHSVGATVDSQSFMGAGRSKKEARKRVATEILIKLFDWKGSCC